MEQHDGIAIRKDWKVVNSPNDEMPPYEELLKQLVSMLGLGDARVTVIPIEL